MNPIWGPVAGGFIIDMMLVCIGIGVFAWQPRHHRAFNGLANWPMDDNDAAAIEMDD